jgi:hypothetical protein
MWRRHTRVGKGLSTQKMPRPFAQGGFANVEALSLSLSLSLSTDGLDHKVNMGTECIGVQGDHVAVLEGKFFSGEVLDRCENLFGWRSRRHGENHFVD